MNKTLNLRLFELLKDKFSCCVKTFLIIFNLGSMDTQGVCREDLRQGSQTPSPRALSAPWEGPMWPANLKKIKINTWNIMPNSQHDIHYFYIENSMQFFFTFSRDPAAHFSIRILHPWFSRSTEGIKEKECSKKSYLSGQFGWPRCPSCMKGWEPQLYKGANCNPIKHRHLEIKNKA